MTNHQNDSANKDYLRKSVVRIASRRIRKMIAESKLLFDKHLDGSYASSSCSACTQYIGQVEAYKECLIMLKELSK